jgi:hypothetical protein
MPRTFCERVANPLLRLHRRTSSPLGMAFLGLAALLLIGYGFVIGNCHIIWGGTLGIVIAWYGFLLSGCERLLAEKDGELQAAQMSKGKLDV